MDIAVLSARVKLRHLRCLIVVAQSRTLRQASQRLAITQPAVTKTLGELERIVGMRLLDRGRDGAALTAAGQLFLPYATRAFASLADGLERLSDPPLPLLPAIRLGVLPTAASALIPPALKAFQYRHSAVKLDITHERNSVLLEQLRAGALDFALARLAEPQEMAGMTFEHLCREPLSVVVRAGHPLADAHALTAEQLERYPLILPPAGTLIRQSADSILASLSATHQCGRIESLSNSLNRALTRGNDAIWFVPRSLVEEDLLDGSLIALAFPFAGTDEPLGLMLRAGQSLSPAAQHLLDCLRQVGCEREARRIVGENPDRDR